MQLRKPRQPLILLACAAAIALSLAGIAYAMGASANARFEEQAQKGELVRLHIIANSDSPRDQSIKLMVRDAILKTFTPDLAGAADYRECYARVQTLRPAMEQRAREVLLAQGFVGSVRAMVGYYDFPDRTYGGLFVPAGVYPALRIVIGQGQGHNWWCVMYPPLCLPGLDGLAAPTEVQFHSALADWLAPPAYATPSTLPPDADSDPAPEDVSISLDSLATPSAFTTPGALPPDGNDADAPILSLVPCLLDAYASQNGKE